MKAATLPSLRVDDELRAAAESVLGADETLSAFLLDSVRRNIERRKAQKEFLSRGLLAKDEARASDSYVSATDMLTRLDEVLARTCKARASA